MKGHKEVSYMQCEQLCTDDSAQNNIPWRNIMSFLTFITITVVSSLIYLWINKEPYSRSLDLFVETKHNAVLLYAAITIAGYILQWCFISWIGMPVWVLLLLHTGGVLISLLSREVTKAFWRAIQEA